MEKEEYKTKQKEELLELLKSAEGRHFTVQDVCDRLEKNGKKIGTTTVYRQMEKLIEKGLVKKYVFEPGTPVCFEYVNPEDNCKREGCCHLKCVKCGKLIHLHCDEIKTTEDHLMEHHKFKIDPYRTVLYGLCEDCQ